MLILALSVHFPPVANPSLVGRWKGDSLEQVLRSSLMRKPSEHWQTKDSSVFRHSCSQPWSCCAQWSTPALVTNIGKHKGLRCPCLTVSQSLPGGNSSHREASTLPHTTGLAGKSALLHVIASSNGLDKPGVTWGEEPSIEKLPPPNWPVGTCGTFLIVD